MTRRRTRAPRRRGAAARSQSPIQARSASAAVSPGGPVAQARLERRERLLAVREGELLLVREVAPRPCGARRRRPRRSAGSSSRRSPGGRTARAPRGRSPRACARACARAGRLARRRRDRAIVSHSCKSLQICRACKIRARSCRYPARSRMSSLLARLARTLTHHWKRGLAGADRRHRPARRGRRRGRRGGGRLLDPGHGVPAGARPLQGAQPRLRGRRLDARLQRRGGQDLRRRPARRDHGRARARSASSTGVEQVADPFAEGGAVSPDGRLAAGRRALPHRAAGPREGRRRGAARRRPRPPSATASTSPRAAS